MIICSNEGEEKSHFISKLHLFKRHYVCPSDPQEYQNYLLTKFTRQSKKWNESTFRDEAPVPASVVDYEGYVCSGNGAGSGAPGADLISVCVWLQQYAYASTDVSG